MAHTPDHYIGENSVLNATADEYDESGKLASERFFTASDHQTVIELRKCIQDLAVRIDLLVPPGRNKALTALEDVQMRANRGIFAPEHLR